MVNGRASAERAGKTLNGQATLLDFLHQCWPLFALQGQQNEASPIRAADKTETRHAKNTEHALPGSGVASRVTGPRGSLCGAQFLPTITSITSIHYRWLFPQATDRRYQISFALRVS